MKVQTWGRLGIFLGGACVVAGLESQSMPPAPHDPAQWVAQKKGEIPSKDDDESAEEGFSIGSQFQGGYQDPRKELNNEKVAFQTPFGQVKWPEIADKLYLQGNRYYAKYKGFTLLLTLDPQLQIAALASLNREKYISGATTLVEAHTGRILAMAERRGEVSSPLTQAGGSILVSARAPAASLMKIVTATAALEKGTLQPESEIPFRGACGKLRSQNWLRSDRLDRQEMTLAHAFGVSCNTVFARVALYQAGLASLKTYAERYHFNTPIPSDIQIETSAALYPQLETATPLEVGEAGAGFGASKLSPVHAALLSATASHDGIMMAPWLVESAFDSSGKMVYQGKPRELGRVFSAPVADKMFRLMQDTIMSGTSRKYFRRKGTAQGRNEIGGKTGTLSDAEDRGTLYTWFSGAAPMGDPRSVAVGTLVASPQNWVVRASSIAQANLADMLRLWDVNQRVATGKSP